MGWTCPRRLRRRGRHRRQRRHGRLVRRHGGDGGAGGGVSGRGTELEAACVAGHERVGVGELYQIGGIEFGPSRDLRRHVSEREPARQCRLITSRAHRLQHVFSLFSRLLTHLSSLNSSASCLITSLTPFAKPTHPFFFPFFHFFLSPPPRVRARIQQTWTRCKMSSACECEMEGPVPCGVSLSEFNTWPVAEDLVPLMRSAEPHTRDANPVDRGDRQLTTSSARYTAPTRLLFFSGPSALRGHLLLS